MKQRNVTQTGVQLDGLPVSWDFLLKFVDARDNHGLDGGPVVKPQVTAMEKTDF